MKWLPTTVIILLACSLAACASNKSATSTPGSTQAAAGAEQATDPATEDAGLGPIVYNGQTMAECDKQVRTGTRIRRQVCKPNAFNGLFPGGINMGVRGEKQPGYGRN